MTGLEATGAGRAAADGTGPLQVGSDAHLTLFCRTLLDTHDPYRPAVIAWPRLDADTRARIIALPIWDIAVQTEERAGLNVQSYADGLAPGLLRRAVEMNAFEERRHRTVLSHMVAFYGIPLAPEPAYPRPRDAEWAFMVTGYSECIDSVFGFGLFELARRSGFFPPALVDTFEPVMREEGRHILFFVNWVAWRRRNLPWWRRPGFQLRIMAVWLFLVWERLALARRMDAPGSAGDSNFTLNGARELGVEVTFGDFVRLCLAANAERLAPYDERLLRPRFVPAVLRLAARFSRPATPP